MASLVRRHVQTSVAWTAPRIDVRKSAQAASAIVRRNGGRIGVDRLLRLLYLLDRRLVERDGHSLTRDDYLAVPGVGFVPSGLAAHAWAEVPADSPWHRSLRMEGDYLVATGVVTDALSRVELEAVDSVVDDYLGLEADDFAAKLAVEAPEGAVVEASFPATLADVLVALGEEAAAARAAYREFDSLRNIKHKRERSSSAAESSA